MNKKEIIDVLKNVKHPEIDNNLVDIGIVKDVKVNKDKVTVVMAFPFPNIPIKDMLIDSVKEPLKKLGLTVEIETTVMNEDELQKFLSLEQQGWRGF